jgi:methanogenic corrinoid protein MtbC1
MDRQIESPQTAPSGAVDHNLSRRSGDVLKRIVEQHIVPRLVLSHPHEVRPQLDTRAVVRRIADMTELALKADDAGTREMLSTLSREGASHDALQLGLIAPAAEQLGRLWQDDQIGFLDVTIATNSLLRSMRFVSLELERLPRSDSGGSAILVAPAPGDGHGFGAAMAAEFFRRGGWQVRNLPGPTRDELVAEAARQPFDVVGLSLTEETGLTRLTHAIAVVRRRSLNPNVVIIVGGPVFAADPSLVSAVGADAAIAAVELAPSETRSVMRQMEKLR